MNTIKRNFLFITIILLTIMMAFQIIISFYWMSMNFSIIPEFGDTAEYISLSNTLKPDEYRAILFPLILRYLTKLQNVTSIPMQTMLYILQTVTCFIVLLYFFNTLFKIILNKYSFFLQNKKIINGYIIFFSLYILSIPLITYFNFTVLTDSLALTILIWYISSLTNFLFLPKNNLLIIVNIIVSFILQGIIRSERVFVCSVLLIICCIIKYILAHKQNQKHKLIQIGAVSLVLLLFSTTTVSFINSQTQTPGLYNRAELNLPLMLLNRVVWSNMSTNYEYFSEEVKSIITYEDAKQIDSHNNNITYMAAPKFEAALGKEHANEVYLEMAKTVFINQPNVIIINILEDFSMFVFSPIMNYIALDGNYECADVWNVSRMASVHPNITYFYYKYYVYSFQFICWIIILFCIIRVNSYSRKYAYLLLPMLFALLIISASFSIGSGAPPNFRYTLISYCCWSTAFLLSYLDLVFIRIKSK